MFFAATVLVALIAGALSALTGFGIGTLLTPWFAIELGMKIAVAVVSIPHIIGNLVRFRLLRKHVDRKLFIKFGLPSAASAVLGALLQTQIESPTLAIVFAALLVLAGVMGIMGWSERIRFHGKSATIAGAVSGFFGGLVGHQGGIRSASMLGFDISQETLVATATAIGLIVDLARMPVYFATKGSEIVDSWLLIVVATVGVLVGTPAGAWALKRFPERHYKRVLAFLILALGVSMFFREQT